MMVIYYVVGDFEEEEKWKKKRILQFNLSLSGRKVSRKKNYFY